MTVVAPSDDVICGRSGGAAGADTTGGLHLDYTRIVQESSAGAGQGAALSGDC